MAVNEHPPLERTPGPRWGARFLIAVEQRVPDVFYRPLLAIGTWVAVLVMDRRRDFSQAFLTQALGRPARWSDVRRHFGSFVDVMLLRMRVLHGAPHRCRAAPGGEDFEALLRSGEPALFGTFHFGHSDLIGFQLSDFDRRVAMVRTRATDSEDIERLSRDFDRVSFIWSNDPANLLFALKSALEGGQSLALQCDRLGSSAKTADFDFLGARRTFPFTIYHLALLYGRPVAFSFGLPDGEGGTWVHASSVFRPDPTVSREMNLTRARIHFQAVLSQLETMVRQHPTLWFNFLPLNPEAANASFRPGS